jgi:uncharacterized protein YacL
MKRGIQAVALVAGFFVGYQYRLDVGRLLGRLGVTGVERLSEGSRGLLGTAVVALAFLLVAVLAGEWLARSLQRVETTLRLMPASELLIRGAGVTAALLVSALLYPLLSGLAAGSPILALTATIFLVWYGCRLARTRGAELWKVWRGRREEAEEEDEEARQERKILDTSVIIDGRIADICKTGFIEGTLVIPGFILEELQHIADSSDLLKRNRGRRGLDILNKIQKELDVKVEIYEGDFEEIAEVDSKLVRLAKVMGGKVLTNDFNLNKVCELQGVSVLNINDLANAVKPVVLPGEEIVVQVIKDGKEHGQGVAYLDDGTMIVVEGGRDFIGSTMEVMVTSVLQTSAGRMIFAKPKLLEKAQ